jgi:hypothetical protein
MDLDFGVFYTCYKEVESVKYSLDVLWQVYPDCPVYLVSDGGADYGFLKGMHDRLEVRMEEDSRGFVPKINSNTYSSKENQELIKKSIVTFLDRVERSIKFCGKPWLLVMEPDVLVRGKLSAPEGVVMLGSRINKGLEFELRRVVCSVPGSIDVNVWGATPVLFDCNALLKAKHVLLETPDLLNKLCLSDCRLANYDVLFSVMFACAGYEETFNPEIVECLRESNWKNTQKPLVHQFRELYPKKESGYDGRHADGV